MIEPKLSTLVWRGGFYLGMRQALGLAVNVAGMLLLTRVIGPTEYGLYAGALGFFTTLQLLAQLGIGVFLIRHEQPLDRGTLDLATTLFVLLAVVGMAIGVLTLPALAALSRLDGIQGPALALYAGLPVANLTQVASAQLDRNLMYRHIAWIELGGQITYFLVAITCALARWGVWAPVSAWWLQQLLVLGAYLMAAKYRPRLAWDSARAREMLAYGASYSASIWIFQLRRVINPLVVGRYLGAEAVAIVSLCAQIATHLSFVAVATWRLSTSVLARVQTEPDRLLRAINQGMRLQTLAVAPFLLLFAWLSPWLIPSLIGADWISIAELFPFVAAAALANTLFTMQSSALYVLRRNFSVGLTHAVQLAVLAALAWVLVPRLGLWGYGLAELGTSVSFVVLHRATVRSIGRPAYGSAAAWAIISVFALFVHTLGPVSLIAVSLALLILRPWRDLRAVVQSVRAAYSGS